MNWKRGLGLLLGGVLMVGAVRAQEHNDPPKPPKPAAEPVPPQPGPGFVWESPYYEWNHDKYVWTKGKWERPPQPGWIWIHGSWTTHGGKRMWGEAHWRKALPGETQPMDGTSASAVN